MIGCEAAVQAAPIERFLFAGRARKLGEDRHLLGQSIANTYLPGGRSEPNPVFEK